MSEYNYAWEKLYTSVSCLAGRGTQKERLQNALVSALSRIVHEDDLPEELRERFRNLMARFHQIRTVGTVGGFDKNVELMSDDEISKAVDEILNLYDAVCRYQEPHT